MQTAPVEVGIGLPVVQQVPAQTQAWEAGAGAAEIVQVAQAADRLGYAWVGCSDHVAVPASYVPSMGATWYEPATALAFIAAVTKRVRLLSHVLVVPYRHPLVVAKTFATLDALSGGRVIIGAGTGHLKPEFRSLGIDHAQRGALTDEYLRAIAVALEEESSSFSGAHVAWRDLMIAPRALQQPRPPLWIGGNTEAMARRAGQLGEGWIPWQIDVDAFAAGASVVEREHRSAGRSGSLALIAPLAAGRVEDPRRLAEVVTRRRDAGATGFHVGFSHRSAGDLVELLERFAHGVLPLL